MSLAYFFLGFAGAAVGVAAGVDSEGSCTPSFGSVVGVAFLESLFGEF